MAIKNLYAPTGRKQNPGNGVFRLNSSAFFSSLSVAQPEPEDGDAYPALVGTIACSLYGDDGGGTDNVIDLAAGDRWIGFAGPVPCIDLTISGVDPDADFSLVVG
jgi:hypothetical protein